MSKDHATNKAPSAPGGAAAKPPARLAVRVYYEDTDFSGVVYHASYLRFLERGRTELLRAAGVGHRDLFENGEGVHFAVRSMSIEFLKPALMDDLIEVETRIAAVGGASIDMRQAILRGEERLIAAAVRIAVISGGRAARLPQALRARLCDVG
ncbi:tol-pal system-associated acyl-CoA thioesterase [Methylocella sp.]|uniref:tol-pal system-associated acyl-CoA thioesterase n=1 Tax=Methylocella sp. TaxID=1978226 RepID=UPI0037830F5D